MAGSWLQGVELELYSPEELLRGPHQRGQRQHPAAQPTAPQQRQQHRPPDMVPPETGPSGGAGWFSLPWFGSHHGPSENGRISSPGGSSSDGDSGNRPAALYPPSVSGCMGAHAAGRQPPSAPGCTQVVLALPHTHACCTVLGPVVSMAAAALQPLLVMHRALTSGEHGSSCSGAAVGSTWTNMRASAAHTCMQAALHRDVCFRSHASGQH